jgi:DNA end-binding protein Ku
MVETEKYAFAQVVMSGKEQLVLLRPADNGVLIMSGLAYESEVKGMAEFEGEAPKAEVLPAEMGIAKSLIEAMSPEEFDFSQYRNTYTDKLTALIEAKMAGKEVVAAPQEESPQVVNLMEALQKSLTAAKKASAGSKPPKLNAPSASPAAVAAGAKGRKRKSS